VPTSLTDRPGVVVPGAGQFDPLPAEHPPPPAKQINNPAVDIKVIKPGGDRRSDQPGGHVGGR
jgi:hypothetical protein